MLSNMILPNGEFLVELPDDPIAFTQFLYAHKAQAGLLLESYGKERLAKILDHFITFNTTLSMLPSDTLRNVLCILLGAEWVKSRITTSDEFISILKNFRDTNELLKFCRLVGAEFFVKYLSNGLSLIKFFLILKHPEHRQIYFNAICKNNPSHVVKTGNHLYNLLILLPEKNRETIAKSCSLALQEELGLYLTYLPKKEKIRFIKDNAYFASLDRPHALLQQRIVEIINNYNKCVNTAKHMWRLNALLEETKIAIVTAHDNSALNPDNSQEYYVHAAQFIIKRMEALFVELRQRRISLFNAATAEAYLVDTLNYDTENYHCTRLLAVTLHQAYDYFSDIIKKDAARTQLAKQVAQIVPLASYKFSTLNVKYRRKQKSDVEMVAMTVRPT